MPNMPDGPVEFGVFLPKPVAKRRFPEISELIDREPGSVIPMGVVDGTRIVVTKEEIEAAMGGN